MRIVSRFVGSVLVLGVGFVAPATVWATSTSDIHREERLVNVLLGQNQDRINHQDNAIAKQNALISLVPVAGARQAQVIGGINQLNTNLANAKPRLENGLNKTAAQLAKMELKSSTNPFVEQQLLLYLQRTQLIFAAQQQQASFIINRPPASAFNFSSGVDPFGLARTSSVRHVATPAHVRPTAAELRNERVLLRDERRR